MTKSKAKTKAKKATRQPAPKRAGKLQADKRTLGTIAGLAKIQYTQKEAGAVMGVSESTFAAFLKTTPARDTWDLGREYWTGPPVVISSASSFRRLDAFEHGICFAEIGHELRETNEPVLEVPR